MHTIELLEECLAAAQRLGYQVRHEWLGGIGGGGCEFAGRRWLFVDLGLSAAEQLEQAATALRGDARLPAERLSLPLARLLAPRRAAA